MIVISVLLKLLQLLILIQNRKEILMTIFIKVKESKESDTMLVKVVDPASIAVDVKSNSVKVLLMSCTTIDIVNNLTNEHYDVTDVDFMAYDADDELETFYIYDVIEVRVH